MRAITQRALSRSRSGRCVPGDARSSTGDSARADAEGRTQIDKRVFNPAELRRGTRPVLTHMGRSSGATYRTPLDVHPVDGGYVSVLAYGSQSDWVRNVLTDGRARLTIDGEDIELAAPRLICGQEAWRPSARR
jgi:deazaflavin-dependent oxidoreductase (nitroreductase family)